MPPQFTWLNFTNAKAQLAARLADPNELFWIDAELGAYIIEALRMWNALTEMWNVDWVFQATVAATWYNLATMANSPRLRSVTDDSLYTMMQYHLIEPPTGAGTWTGTSQFSLSDLQGALQRRRDEVIQLSGCNLSQISVPVIVDLESWRVFFGDNVLEPRRIRYKPVAPGSVVTLTREDTAAFDYFEVDHLQSPGPPNSWSLITQPPLAMDTDVPPNLPGNFDVIALQSGPVFAPPAATLLGVPDDWSWLPKWGALADLLSRESEATDIPRAQYCLKRYMDGLKLMQASNWIVAAKINEVPCDIPSLAEMDRYAPEWELDSTQWPNVVQAGMDFIAACPVATGAQQIGVNVSVVQNAPVPVLNTDFIQASRDVWDSILSYAQALAMFKQGGAEAKAAAELDAVFFAAAAMQNTRLSKLGIFVDTIRSEGKREDQNQERW